MGNTIYNILYPTPKTKNGSCRVAMKQQIETNFNTFSGTKGTEIVWLIWTSAKKEDFEEARQLAFGNQGTVKTKANVQKTKKFIGK